MKRKLFCIAIIITVFIISCTKKNNNASQQQIMMFAAVNGRQWAARQANVSVIQADALHITIHVDSGNTNINLYVNNFIGNGIYPLVMANSIADSPNRAYFTETVAGKNIVHYAINGQIIIQNYYQFTGTMRGIEGYFDFNTDTVSITNGYFSMTLNLE